MKKSFSPILFFLLLFSFPFSAIAAESEQRETVVIDATAPEKDEPLRDQELIAELELLELLDLLENLNALASMEDTP